MFLLVNNLHEKRIPESQDGRNLGSARYLSFALVLCENHTSFQPTRRA